MSYGTLRGGGSPRFRPDLGLNTSSRRLEALAVAGPLRPGFSVRDIWIHRTDVRRRQNGRTPLHLDPEAYNRVGKESWRLRQSPYIPH